MLKCAEDGQRHVAQEAGESGETRYVIKNLVRLQVAAKLIARTALARCSGGLVDAISSTPESRRRGGSAAQGTRGGRRTGKYARSHDTLPREPYTSPASGAHSQRRAPRIAYKLLILRACTLPPPHRALKTYTRGDPSIKNAHVHNFNLRIVRIQIILFFLKLQLNMKHFILCITLYKFFTSRITGRWSPVGVEKRVAAGSRNTQCTRVLSPGVRKVTERQDCRMSRGHLHICTLQPTKKILTQRICV